jgi:RimJ/RimL family protein N-acetyltransferase
MTPAPIIDTNRLRLQPFADEDAPALAAILAEPEVTKNITANGSTPERCLASARHRIGWHNRSWDERGYGVWAVKGRSGNLLGWCGFAAPDIGDDPEILYGLAPQHWRRGLGMEAAQAAMKWLFAETGAGGVSAVVFGRLNPGSVAMIGKLGLTPRGIMGMADFMPDRQLAKDVLDYEIWRLAAGATLDAQALLFQAPHKGGQFATLDLGDPDGIEQMFCDAAHGRADYKTMPRDERDARVRDAFQQGMAQAHLDWYHLPRAAWRGAQ